VPHPCPPGTARTGRGIGILRLGIEQGFPAKQAGQVRGFRAYPGTGRHRRHLKVVAAGLAAGLALVLAALVTRTAPLFWAGYGLEV